jgi:hypothetical protein
VDQVIDAELAVFDGLSGLIENVLHDFCVGDTGNAGTVLAKTPSARIPWAAIADYGRRIGTAIRLTERLNFQFRAEASTR